MITFLKPEEQHQHPNGGGWVANTATVDASAFVGSDAQVMSRVQLYYANCADQIQGLIDQEGA